jgi:hypothetical protein
VACLARRQSTKRGGLDGAHRRAPLAEDRPGGDLVRGFGFRRDEEPDGEEARQRHASLVTLLGIAERLDPPGSAGPGPDDGSGGEVGMAEFLEEMGRRAAREAEGVGAG